MVCTHTVVFPTCAMSIAHAFTYMYKTCTSLPILSLCPHPPDGPEGVSTSIIQWSVSEGERLLPLVSLLCSDSWCW